MRTRILPQQPAFIVALITILAALLRFYHLGFKPLWLDEAGLYWVSQGTLSEIIANNAQNNSAPPLFALLLNVVSALGDSEAALRLLPALAGIATVPAVYLLARQVLGHAASYFCAGLVALSTSQVSYSQQVREYSLTVLVATFILFFFYRYLREPGWVNGVAFTVCG